MLTGKNNYFTAMDTWTKTRKRVPHSVYYCKYECYSSGVYMGKNRDSQDFLPIKLDSRMQFKKDSDDFHYSAKIAGRNLLENCQCNAKIPVTRAVTNNS
ncbi:hypothetical protein [Nitrosomonas sp. Nm33]|uniref:hypothetical protein n=1 Tax=Nitrosomonas sp. Nm33 TaxID=133724 RepID=UPI00089AEEFD|nr:hypothetical protein [Nitrosomonas sp. Nm33]SDY41967.1 hypothetical protein SAMN05421755_102134 [Nitrosomonas sp. Nm33]